MMGLTIKGFDVLEILRKKTLREGFRDLLKGKVSCLKGKKERMTVEEGL